MTTNQEQCGYPTAEDNPCQHPTTDDGDPDRCWISSHNETETTSGDPGRPFSLTPDDHQDILNAAREGLSKSGCARAAGVSHTELNRYLDAHDEFRAAFAQARAKGETRLVRDGLRDPETDSSMAKFLLSTSFQYIKTEKREVDMDADVNQSLNEEDKEMLDALLDRDVQQE